MKENIIIRHAAMEDMQSLLAFEQGIITAERPFTSILKPDPISYYDLPAMINDLNVDLVVAELDGKLIASGYARVEIPKQYYTPPKQGYFGMMYVLPEHRGKGINAMILDELKRLTKERGINEITLEVFSRNEAAHKAYLKFGFEDHMIQMRMTI